MRIIGIDPGTGILGFGVIEKKPKRVQMIEAGVIRTKKESPDHVRLLEIYQNIEQIIKETQPSIMSIEKLFFARNVTTAMQVSQARGVALLAAAKFKLEVFEYTPLQIKMALTGYGKAEKKQIQEMVRVILGLKCIPKPDDCADALAAALTHEQTLRYNSIDEKIV